MRAISLRALTSRHARAHLFVGFVLVLAVVSGLHHWLRDAIVDARFRVAARPASGTIALIDIDAKSIAAVGHWPWRRTLHGELLKQLGDAGAADIAFDVDFSSPSTAAEDAAFAEALRQAGGAVVLPAFRQRFDAQGGGAVLHVNKPIPQFLAESWPALVDVRPDLDGVARHYTFGDPIDGTFIPSMGALLAGQQKENGQEFRIDFGILSSTIPRFSYIDVLRGEPSVLQALNGRKVIVAGSAAELGDRLNVPNGTILPGSVVLALAAESILQGRILTTTSSAISAVVIAGVMLLMALAWTRTRVGTRIAGLVGLIVSVEVIALALQSQSAVVIDTSLLWSACFAYLFAAMLDEIALRGILQLVAERRFQRITLSLSDGLVCTDNMGCITFWNPAAAAMFGYDAGSRIGLPFGLLLKAREPSGERFSLTAIPLDQLRRGNGYVTEHVGRRRSGDVFDLECSLSAWDTPGGVQYGAILRDISVRKREQERIRYLAECDVLTGLRNRNSLLVELHLAHGERTALLLVAINRFAEINRLHGASFADALLVAVAYRLKVLAASAKFIARLSDEDFAVIVACDAADALGHRIIADFQKDTVMLDTRDYRVSVAVGCAPADTASHAEDWLGNAQFALTAAQSATQPKPVDFSASMRRVIEQREALEFELRRALARGEFELFYQPQFDLQTGGLIGAEALIRWHHPERGYISPGEFMPVVQMTSLAEGVSSWVMTAAFRQTAVWHRAGYRVRVGINLSQCQFSTGNLVAEVDALLASTGVPPELIELEVTEDIILDNVQKTNAVFSALRSRSIKMAFDDFGTGYGSLTYLKQFALDTLKIDKTFVRNLSVGTDDAVIVKATIELGRSLGLSIIAEGIETEATSRILHDLGCDEGQGYHFGKPISAADFEARFLTCCGSWEAA